MHVTSSLPNGQITRDNIRLYKRLVLITDAGCELTPEWLHVAQRHLVVLAPRSHHAGIWLNVAQEHPAFCALRFLHERPFLWFDFRKNPQGSGAKTTILTTKCQVHGVLHGRHESAMASGTECGCHTDGHGCSCPPCLFSESGSVRRLCTRQLELCTDAKFPQNPQMQWRRVHYNMCPTWL